MVLYKLPFAFFPIRDVYARDKMDIAEWLEWFAKQDIKQNIEIVGRTSNVSAGIEQIVEVAGGELKFDFEGIVAGNKYAEVFLTEDFVAKIRLESVPYFKSHQSRLQLRTAGNLYAVQTYHGVYSATNYVPQDVFQALCVCDISMWEEAAEEHLKKLNEALQQLRRSGVFYTLPKPCKGKFN